MAGTLAAAEGLPSQDVTVLLLSLAALMGLAKVLGEVATRFGQPSVLGEITAGILLGQTVLGTLAPETFQWLFPDPAEGSGPALALQGFIALSATLLLLVAGMEVDLTTVFRQGRAALFVGLLGLSVPFAFGAAAAGWWPKPIGIGQAANVLPFAIFVGIALSITALPVVAKILIDLNISKSDLGMLIIASAMINDIVGWIGFAVVLAMISPNSATDGTSAAIGLTILFTMLFIVAMVTIGRFAFHRMIPYVQAHWHWPGGMLVFVMVVALLSAALTEYIGIHAIFGAFIAGVALGDSHHLRRRTRDTIHEFIMNIFAPLFFASIALRINFLVEFNLMLILVILAVACTGKMAGCVLGARLAGVAGRQSLGVGLGMVTQGALGIILGQLALEKGLITEPLMVAIVVMALATSFLSGPLLKKVLRIKTKQKMVDLLSEKHLIPILRGTDAQSVIGELTARAAQLSALDAKSIYEAVWKRERMMGTGLPDGLAVPHARLTGLKKSMVVLGRSEGNVDFDASDGSRARLICLLLTPQENSMAQLELLQLVGDTFDQPEKRNAVLHASNETEMLAGLRLGEAPITPNEAEGAK